MSSPVLACSGSHRCPWPTLAAASSRAPIAFKAYRNDAPLGFHRIDFTREGRRLKVDIEIAFDVSFAIIPLYRYRHRNREVWENGRLLKLESETDDDGETFTVSADRDGDHILVDATTGRLELPGDTVTTSYWNEAAVTRGEWLDTQSGRLVRSTVTRKPPEPVKILGQSVEATPYELAGDITCTLWYRDGRWVGLRFIGEDGSVIDYLLETEGQSG